MLTYNTTPTLTLQGWVVLVLGVDDEAFFVHERQFAQLGADGMHFPSVANLELILLLDFADAEVADILWKQVHASLLST